jgi:hypothetical protein
MPARENTDIGPNLAKRWRVDRIATRNQEAKAMRASDRISSSIRSHAPMNLVAACENLTSVPISLFGTRFALS